MHLKAPEVSQPLATLHVPFSALPGRLAHVNQRRHRFEALRGDAARLLAAGPLPRWVTAKQLKVGTHSA